MEGIAQVNSVGKLVELIRSLGYTAKSQSLYIPEIDPPESARNLLLELNLLADYNRQFQIYFAKTKSFRRTDFRTILEPFYRRYPQINTLFIITKDWQEIAFISPQRVAKELRVAKLLLRILFIDRENVYHTDLEVLENIRILPTEQTPEIIWQKHLEAFNVEKVTEDFFEAYKSALKFIEGVLLSQNKATHQQVHTFAQQLLSRIMFLYFVQKKGWLKWKDYGQDKKYIKNLWQKYQKYKTKKDTFYSQWLSVLFFKGFQGPGKHAYIHNDPNLSAEIKESFVIMPFLNGGLFTENELDEIGFKVPDEIFKLLFEIDPLDKRKGFLERYNFTIREDTPLEVEVAVDPEMLGKVYESLISEEERGKAGIFYTPRIEIDYMCRLSLTEYVSEETKIPKTEIIPLIFEPQKILEYDDKVKLKKIKEAIDKVRIVDPAVGSASFLVGMMNVLVEIQRNLSLRLDKKEENLFALKNKVISENLYGVDVKDWAVMVGELRLWLSLIIETEEKYMYLYTQPLLPNLSFKMRQGDSLIEEIADVPISLRARFSYIQPTIKDKINKLIDRKREYFSGRISANLKEKVEIENLENEIFKEIVSNEMKRLESEEKKLRIQISAPKPEQTEMFGLKPEQKELFEEQIQKLKVKIKELESEKEKYQKVLDNIGKKRTKDYFLWEIDFTEVFAEKGGFDIVIGNPPYVLYKRIVPPLGIEGKYDKVTWERKKEDYKQKLRDAIKIHWRGTAKINGRSDLYVYFYYIGLSLLRVNGIFCFISSDGWLNDDYGIPLQEFLLKNMYLLYIVDNQIKRSFKESDLYTVIVCIKNCRIEKHELIKFVTFKKPFDEVLNSNNLIEIEEAQKVKCTEDFRIFPITKEEILKDGVVLPDEEALIIDPEHLPYVGTKWGGKYLRAPEIFFTVIEKGKKKLTKLGDVAFIRTGIKEGGYKKYILSKEKVLNASVAKSFIPILKDVKCHSYVNILENDSFIFKNISKFKKKCEMRRSEILWLAARGSTHKCHKNVNHFPFTGNYLGIELVDKGKENLIIGILNSTLLILFSEILGRSKGIGGGAITITKSDLEKLPILSFDTLNLQQVKSIERITKTEIGKRKFYSIFEECGINPNPPEDWQGSISDWIRSQEPNPLPDRKELDDIIFDILGLTKQERKEVYWSVCELVKNRLEKAKSV